MTEADTQRLVHELEVHQIELEMQNEQLRHAQVEMEESHRKYSGLFDFAPVGYFTLARDGAIHQVNLTGAKLLGLERGKLVNRRFGVFVSAQSRAIFNAFIEKVFTSGNNETCEVALLKDETVWARIEAVLDQVERETCRVVVSDITARVRAEEMLRESEMRAKKNNILLRAILESPLGMVIFALDTDFCYIAFTRTHKNTMKAIWGVEIEIGMNMLDAISGPLDREKARKNFECALRGEHFILIEEYGDPAIYRTFYEDRYSPIHDETGAIIGITVFVTDITERKQAEEALKESEANLQAILASTDDIIASYDREIHLLTYNPACAKNYRNLFGVELRHGLRTLDLFPESMRGFWTTNNARALAGESFSVEFNMSTPDNRGCLFESHFNPIRNNGDVVGFSTFTRDITERKQAEQALRESEARFRVMFEQAAVGVAQLQTATGYFVSINQKFCDIVGYSRAEMEKMNFQAITHEDDLKIDLANMELLKSGKIRKFSMEKRYYGKSGDTIWVNLTVSPMWAEGETPNYHIAIVEDITERKQAEEKLQKSEASLRAIFENSVQSFLLIDLNRRIQSFNQIANERVVKTFGKEIHQDDSIYEMVVPRDREDFDRDFQRALNGESVRTEKSFTVGAVELCYEFHYAPVRIDGQQVSGVFFSVTDVTERKRAEEALQKSEAALKKVQEIGHMGSWEIDLATKMVIASAESHRIYGIPEDSVTLAYVQLAPLPEFRPALDAALTALITKGELYDVEFKIQRLPDGEIRAIHSIAEYDASRQMVIGSMQDITERKQAEEALRESEEKFRAIIEQSNNGIILIDEQGTIIEWNRAQEQITGIMRNEALGQPAWDIQIRQITTARRDQVALERIKQILLKMLETGQSPQFNQLIELPLQTASGEQRATLQNAFSIKTDKGYRLGIIFQDITKRKQLEDEIATAKARLEMIVTSSAVMLYASQVFGDFDAAYVSDNIGAIAGYTRQDFLSKGFWASHIHPEDAPKIFENIPTLFEQNYYKCEYRFLFKDGAYHWLYDEMKLIRDEAGNPLEIIGTWTDITARKQAEESLRMMAEMLDIAPNAISVHDFNGRFLYTNRKCIELHGYETDEFMALNLHDLDVPESETLIAERMQLVKEKGEAFFEVAHIRKDGTIFPMDVFVKLVEWHGAPAILSVNTDITERKRAEEALRIAEAGFRAIFENAPVGIFQSTPQGQFIRVNPAMARIYGYDSPQDMAASVTNISRQIYVNPSDRQRFQRSLAEHGEVLEFIDHNYCKDQSIIWTQTNARAVKDAQGNAMLYEGFITDITRRKCTEEKLRLTQFAIDTASVAIFWTTPDAHIVDVNDAACRMLGYTRAELLQLSVTDIDASCSAEAWPQHFDELRKQGSLSFESSQRNKDGRLVPVEITANYIQFDDKEFDCAFIRDITARKQAEAELRRAQDDLETAHRELQQSFAREQQLARTDALTGVNSRSYLFELAAHEFDVAMRYRPPLCMLMVDIDDFKRINDTLGHALGDQAIKRIAQVVGAEIRSADTIGRYGAGDEFIILLPQTSAQEALPFAERIHASLAAMRLDTDKGALTLTISIGIAQTLHQPVSEPGHCAQTDTVENLFLRADQALYAAKQAGKNRTVIF